MRCYYLFGVKVVVGHVVMTVFKKYNEWFCADGYWGFARLMCQLRGRWASQNEVSFWHSVWF